MSKERFESDTEFDEYPVNKIKNKQKSEKEFQELSNSMNHIMNKRASSPFTKFTTPKNHSMNLPEISKQLINNHSHEKIKQFEVSILWYFFLQYYFRNIFTSKCKNNNYVFLFDQSIFIKIKE